MVFVQHVFDQYNNIYETQRDALSHQQVEIRWQSLMGILRDPGTEQRSCEEIFHLERQ